MTASFTDIPLPRLRPDLEFFPGPVEKDGSPSFNVLDPLTGVYRKIGWAEEQILARMKKPITLLELMYELNRNTTMRVTPKEIVEFCVHAEKEKLTVGACVGDSNVLAALRKQSKPNPLKWLLSNYLYIRIPLFNPDAYLQRTVGLVRLFASRAALVFYALVFCLGFFLLGQRLEAYISTFPFFFSVEGAVGYVLAVAMVKALHEFSHAYTARAFGVRVPSIGIAFMVLCPLAFCDVTDAWKLKSRSQRLRISIAGVCAEIILAGFALVLWGLTPPGVVHSIAFVLSSVTIVSTVLVNLNPAMRFDGYYILSDLWGIDNLQPRAFAMAKWALRKNLLGIDVPPPEEGVSTQRLCGMLVYSLYAWMYRLGLYIGIAVLVYYKFTKLLGLVLFLFEVCWFLARPVVREAGEIMKMKSSMKFNFRLGLLLLVVLVVFLWAALPLGRRQAVSAVVVSGRQQTIYAPESGVLKRLGVARGDRVEAGDLLVRVSSNKLDTDAEIAKLENRIVELELRRYSASREGGWENLPEKREELAQIKARLLAFDERKKQETVFAAVAGTVYEWDVRLACGQAVSKGDVLGRVADLGKNKVAAFVREDYVAAVKSGEKVFFVSCDGGARLVGKVDSISPLREESIEHAGLSSFFRGELAASKDSAGNMVPLETFYKMDITLQDAHAGLRIGQTGDVWITTGPRSIVADYMRRIWRTLVKESGF